LRKGRAGDDMLHWFMLLALVALQAVPPGPVVRSFDEDKLGLAPPGFEFASGREAPLGRWVVQREGASVVLARVDVPAAPGPQDGFAVAVHADGRYDTLEISVRLKANGGSRAVGLVWKYQDPENHYSAQLDLGRQALALYRVAGGNRILLEREDDLELDPDAWHTLRVVNDTGEIRVYLGGIRVFDERDRGGRGTGSAGLWASGATTASFDDFRITPRTARGR
jgi:hypothetical protein